MSAQISTSRATPPAPARRILSPAARRAVLTTHIIASVGLLGDVAAVLAVNVRAATTTDPQLASSSYELLEMFSMVFGIPLSFIALITGLTLGLGSRWGVLRYLWVTAKLVLLLSVILVGALVIGPANSDMRNGTGDAATVLIVAAAYDVLALSLATALSVYKPGRRAMTRPRPAPTPPREAGTRTGARLLRGRSGPRSRRD